MLPVRLGARELLHCSLPLWFATARASLQATAAKQLSLRLVASGGGAGSGEEAQWARGASAAGLLSVAGNPHVVVPAVWLPMASRVVDAAAES